jgi:hypothetical protein
MERSTNFDRNDPLRKALTHGLAAWAVIAPLWVLVTAALGGRFALDFHYAYLPAARAVVHGVSPYGPISSTAREAFVYPPLSAYLFAPFTLVTPLVAELLATALVAATVPATLLVLGVRDWRSSFSGGRRSSPSRARTSRCLCCSELPSSGATEIAGRSWG